jgi:WS/DGAT/MGAT family acyltransferase
MPALSVIDLAMFMLESRERPFNIGPLVMLAPPRGFKGNFADKLVARMLRRPMGQPWNQKFVAPKLGVPRLDIIDNADPRPQVHRLTLDAPGTQAQLFEKMCQIHATPLDRSKLLWELYVIDGVQGGKVVLYGKVHHGIIDGRTFVQAVSNWFATDPKDPEVRAMWEGGAKAPHQARARASLGKQFGSALKSTVGLTKTAASLYRMLGRQAMTTLGLGASLGGDSLQFPGFKVPKAFAGVASADRSFAYCRLPLSQMKAVGKAHGGTVNDVLLATLDMGMVRYLAAHADKADRPLVADMPIALSGATGGNQIALMQFPLGAPGASPLDRLAQICKETAKLKAVLKRETSDTVMLYTALVHGVPAMVEVLGHKRGLAISNLVVSNPFGLPERRYLMGAEVELVLPVSVVAAGQMLNVTAVTLADSMQVGFVAMPNAVRHVDKLAAYTAQAFEELERAAWQAEQPDAQPARKRTRKASVKATKPTEPDGAYKASTVTGPVRKAPSAPRATPRKRRASMVSPPMQD